MALSIYYMAHLTVPNRYWGLAAFYAYQAYSNTSALMEQLGRKDEVSEEDVNAILALLSSGDR